MRGYGIHGTWAPETVGSQSSEGCVRLANAEVVDPARRPPTDQVFFGATVTTANARDEQRTVRIVGVDEVDLARGHVSWISPIAKALLRAHEGDVVKLRTPTGVEELEIVKVRYV